MTTNKQNIKRPEYWTARIQNSSTIALSNSGHQYTKYKQKVCFCHWKIYLKSAYWQQISRYRCANHENFTTTTTSEHPAPPTPLSIPPSPPPPFESCLNRHWSCLDLHQLSLLQQTFLIQVFTACWEDTQQDWAQNYLFSTFCFLFAQEESLKCGISSIL